MKNYLIMFILFFNCCYSQPLNKKDSDAINTIINFARLSKYLHPEIKGRHPFYIFKNRYIKENTIIKLKNEKIIITDDRAVANGNLIEFLKLNFEKNKCEFSLYYEIENIKYSGVLIFNEDKWYISSYDFIVF